MGTVIEGDWDEIMELIRRCHDEIMKTEERVLISVNDRRQEGQEQAGSRRKCSPWKGDWASP
ncbi:MAG: thiamine-binding protein [Desulfobacterales bacterium]|nr:thiamine-binding protein [Desulfobacterales bacterium]